MKQTKDELIKEVQKLSVAKHTYNELNRMDRSQLELIIKFKKSLKDVKEGRIKKVSNI